MHPATALRLAILCLLLCLSSGPAAAAAAPARDMEAERLELLRQRRIDQLRNNPVHLDVDESRPFLGDPSAPETIVVFTDLQFPDCAEGFFELQKLRDQQPGVFRIAFRHRPMGFHKHSEAAARHFEAALLQDESRAFDYLGMIFRQQRRIFKEGVPALEDLARQAGLDAKRLRRDANSQQIAQLVQDDLARARRLGFTAAPVAVLRGVIITGAAPPGEYMEVLELTGGVQKP